MGACLNQENAARASDLARMNTVLIVTGLLTAVAGIGFFVPRAFLNVLLGMTPNDSTTTLLARHWCLLLALVGGLLVYAGYHAEARVPVMVVATVEKLTIAALVVASPLRRRLVTVAAISADVVMALLYLFLLAPLVWRAS
jgi:uncharacterized membrane protein